jgi:hypothetical protein
MGLSSSLQRGLEGRIREVLQEDGCSSMCSNYHMLIFVKCHVFLQYACNSLRLGKLIRNTDWCLFFRRLKITKTPMSLYLNLAPSRTITNSSNLSYK